MPIGLARFAGVISCAIGQEDDILLHVARHDVRGVCSAIAGRVELAQEAVTRISVSPESPRRAGTREESPGPPFRLERIDLEAARDDAMREYLVVEDDSLCQELLL